ncbi:TPA_asm: RpiR family transcriptional regulator [Listeria innocua]|uniref:RpiR family transcriptional regulator n=1 Tax=Listeria innocua TaxID=1642 RepID=UPI0010D14DEA|nr:RpiR family transcriptional regulator [Listeria innocua]ECQ6353552.1 RpiR family transcriptional regulator [Listeria innocua]MBC1384218.1 RpiR family transcriptional regulator [Listeria innocua]MBC1388045.1 RpiR family transcriptional regulator [Listeria innocua]MBC1416589.1 RpiR family transcriptional regulator [Listeria innocua]HAC3175878.1 RpiR family transcriptional regulator [Listeria innocua]
MKLDGVCKISSALGMEYQFGEFYIDRDYLVFDQNFSLGMKKRQTFPVAKLGHIALVREEEEILLTFSCDNIEFEINGNSHANLREFRDLLQNKGTNSSDIKKAENKKKARYTTHHYHNFAKS